MSRFQAQPEQPMQASSFALSHLDAPDQAYTAQVHELYDGLTSIACNLEAAARWLSREQPDIAEAQVALADLVAAAAEVIQTCAALSTCLNLL